MRMEKAYIRPFSLYGGFGIIYLLVTVRITFKFGFIELFDGWKMQFFR